MATSEGTPSMAFKKFVSQDEVDEKRKQRQEEWDKVRTAEQPIEAPEEEFDNRSLYDRLQQQKQKQQDEHDEQFALKNQVKGLEDEEVKFLDFVSDRQMQLQQERRKEEESLLSELHQSSVQTIGVESTETKTIKPKAVKNVTKPKKSQLQLLAGAVKRKGVDDHDTPEESKKVKTAESTSSAKISSTVNIIPNQKTDTQQNHVSSSSDIETTNNAKTLEPDADNVPQHCVVGRQVVGVLPGMGVYSDSDCSSDSASSPLSDEMNRPTQ